MKLNVYVDIQRVRVKFGWVTGNTSSVVAYFQTFNLVVKRAHTLSSHLFHIEKAVCVRGNMNC